ncbi:ATP-binding protein [Pseudomonas veronii]|mgnify:CR=1 FL=1|uniref:ATP-binding protein n=1 Tax=Pseudomonas veronii TaxID=76761 RepID=UPI00062526B7|nr:ATP-binding protein [Pseudomonas veronii]
MRTIHLKTNQNQLISNLRHAFNQASMLGELLQNARRAQASEIHITVNQDSLTITDNGSGIADLQTLIFIAESGWDESLKSRENAFGLGVLSTLYFAEYLSVHSRNEMFAARTAQILDGEPIEVDGASFFRTGTEIRLEGIKPVQAGEDLPTWAARQLRRLCEAFSVPVWLNGEPIPRPLANSALPWRETSMGKVLLDLDGARTRWRCFLQGLPIGAEPTYWEYGKHQVVLLPDETLAKLPDRQHLLNEMEDSKRIQDAIDQAYREALIEKKAQLAAAQFVEHYAHLCLNSSNADLLNDVPFVPRAWFRDWDKTPAGFHQYWAHETASGIIARDVLEEMGVWQIDTHQDDAPTAEVYLEAAKAFLFDEPGLDDGHWLKPLIRVVTPEQVEVRAGTTLHRDASPCLADYEVELELVDTLHIRLEGQSGHAEYAVDAVRKGDILYLTPNAGSPTVLVSDYVFDDRYDEDCEDEDARTITTFIAVGCSQSADRVVDALLPNALRYVAQPKLAGAVVRLIFDETGKLQTVTF